MRDMLKTIACVLALSFASALIFGVVSYPEEFSIYGIGFKMKPFIIAAFVLALGLYRNNLNPHGYRFLTPKDLAIYLLTTVALVAAYFVTALL